MILLAFISGNSSLESLLEGPFAQIYIDLIDGVSAGIEPETCG